MQIDFFSRLLFRFARRSRKNRRSLVNFLVVSSWRSWSRLGSTSHLPPDAAALFSPENSFTGTSLRVRVHSYADFASVTFLPPPMFSPTHVLSPNSSLRRPRTLVFFERVVLKTSAHLAFKRPTIIPRTVCILKDTETTKMTYKHRDEKTRMRDGEKGRERGRESEGEKRRCISIKMSETKM